METASGHAVPCLHPPDPSCYQLCSQGLDDLAGRYFELYQHQSVQEAWNRVLGHIDAIEHDLVLYPTLCCVCTFLQSVSAEALSCIIDHGL